MTDLSTRVRELNNATKRPTKKKPAKKEAPLMVETPTVTTGYSHVEPIYIDTDSKTTDELCHQLNRKVTLAEIKEYLTVGAMGETLIMGLFIIALLAKALFGF